MTLRLSDVDRIPPNVLRCYHAMRSEETQSRPKWGNCGKMRESNKTTFIHRRDFKCTHGGMGGVPWTATSPDLSLDEKGRIREPYPPQAAKFYGSVVARAALHSFGPTGAVTALLMPTVDAPWTQTTVSLPQEKSWSTHVRNWMKHNLKSAQAIAAT